MVKLQPKNKSRSLPRQKIKKFKLLLDTAFAHPSKYVRLNKKANLAHVRHNYSLSRQAGDEEIYQLATKEKRFVVTIDDDFKKLIKPKGAGVLIAPPYLSVEQMDNLVTDFIKGKNPVNFQGRVIKI